MLEPPLRNWRLNNCATFAIVSCPELSRGGRPRTMMSSHVFLGLLLFAISQELLFVSYVICRIGCSGYFMALMLHRTRSFVLCCPCAIFKIRRMHFIANACSLAMYVHPRSNFQAVGQCDGNDSLICVAVEMLVDFDNYKLLLCHAYS